MPVFNPWCIILTRLVDFLTKIRWFPRSISALFSWPSNGQLIPHMSYDRGHDDARASGRAMGSFLKLRECLGMLLEECCDQRMHIMVHSVGNYAFRHGLFGIRAQLAN